MAVSGDLVADAFKKLPIYEIVTNAEGNRTTPSYVAFTDSERLVGDSAKAQAARNPTNTIYDAKRLIGREFDDPVVQEELEHLPFHVVENHNQPRPRDAAIGATMQGKALPYKRLMPSDRANLVVIPPEEVGARILSHLKRHSERSLPFFRRNLGFAFGSLTVSVPVGFTKAQRAATGAELSSKFTAEGEAAFELQYAKTGSFFRGLDGGPHAP